MENNNRALTRVRRMEDNKWESTHVYIQWGTTNGNQSMSIELTYYTKRRTTIGHQPGFTGWRTTNENQPMSIHNGGRQMGINPCPPSSFYWEYAATKQWAKDGTRLTKPVGAGLTKS